MADATPILAPPLINTTYLDAETGSDIIGVVFETQSVMGASLVALLYVVDSGNHRVQAFDYQGNFKFSFGSFGVVTPEDTANGKFSNPYGICTDGEKLYVTDSGNDRVQVFDLYGAYLFQFGTSGTAVGQFDSPKGIATEGLFLYIADEQNHRFQVFTMNGLDLLAIGSFGTGENQFEYPYEISVDSAYVYVKDTNRTLTFAKTWIPDVYMDAVMGMDSISMEATTRYSEMIFDMPMDTMEMEAITSPVAVMDFTMPMDEVAIVANISTHVATLDATMSMDIVSMVLAPGVLAVMDVTMAMDTIRIVMPSGKIVNIDAIMAMDKMEMEAYQVGPASIDIDMPMDYVDMIAYSGGTY